MPQVIKNRHKIALGIIMVGSLIAVAGFVLMFSRLFSIYGLASSCPTNSVSCNNQLDNYANLIKIGRYMLFGGIVLAGIGGLLASHYDPKRSGH